MASAPLCQRLDDGAVQCARYPLAPASPHGRSTGAGCSPQRRGTTPHACLQRPHPHVHFLLSIALGVSAGLWLLLPLPLGEAAVVAKTLAQTPVTGRLADGGTFQGWLMLQALTLDEAGHLVATGVLSGTARPAVGRATKVPARTF